MLNYFKNLKLNVKIALLGTISVFITALALVILASWQSGQYNKLSQTEVDELINADLDHITQGVYNLVKTQDEAAQNKVNYNLLVAHHILFKEKKLRLSSEKVNWTAINQFSKKSFIINLPKMYLGSKSFDTNFNPASNSSLLKEITDLIGETCTIFQCMNKEGDMLRVSTTVKASGNEKVIGTFIPVINPDGKPNPVLEAIRQGKNYHGRAFVVDSWYLTAYEPLRDNSGNLIGMLYVGVKQKNVESLIRHAILETKVGKTGYVFIIGGKGEDRGHYIISQNGERDGEDIWESKDSDNQYVIQNIINKSLLLKPGEFSTERYRWQNPGEPKPRWKIARLAYYSPWDWVIGTTAYEDELKNYQSILKGGQIRMSTTMGIAGLVIIIIIGLFSAGFAYTIARPIQQMTRAIETISNGNLNQVVEIKSNDEIGMLTRTFNLMTEKLKDTMSGLEKSEENYRSIYENAPEGIYQNSVEGKILRANPAMAKILGYNSAEELCAAVKDLRNQMYVHPEDRDIFISDIIAQGNVLSREIQLFRADGQIIWLSFSSRLVKDDSTGQIYIEGFATDVTYRKQAEAALFESEQKLNNIIKDSPIPTFVIDRNHKVIHWNKSIEKLTNTKAEDIVNTENYKKVFYETERELMLNLLLDEKEDSFPLFYPGKHFISNSVPGAYIGIDFFPKLGDSGRWLRFTASILKNSSGEKVGAIETLEDITDLKMSEEKIKQNEMKFRELFDRAPVGYHEINTSGKIVQVNRTELEMLGYKEDEMIGHYIWEFVVEKEISRKAVESKLSGKAKSSGGFERTFYHKDGSKIPVMIEDMMLKDLNDITIGIRSTIQNITEHKQSESERIRLHNLESIGVLAGGIAHDFNNILTSIMGRASLTYLKMQDDESKTSLNSILEATKRAVGLTKQLLTFSKGEMPEKCLIDLRKIIQDTANFSLSGSNVIAEFNLQELYSIEADPGQISQVIQNLVINAKQAMPMGGKVLITTEDIKNEFNESFIKIIVKDTGAGIPKEYLNHIFDPYFTTKQSGSGLGLAICYSIIKKHGGKISVDSTLGAGTTFEILLPASKKELEIQSENEEKVTQKLKILIMDDEDTVREILKDILGILGHEVVESREGEEAIRLYKENMEMDVRFDLVFLDLTVRGGLGGKETIKILHEIDPKIKAIVSSGYSDDSLSGFVEDGFCSKLDKPYTFQEVNRVIFQIINKNHKNS